MGQIFSERFRLIFLNIKNINRQALTFISKLKICLVFVEKSLFAQLEKIIVFGVRFLR